MYSYENRMRAVKLYIQYDKSAAAVIQELGYPNRHSLKNWYLEYQKSNDLKRKSQRASKYSKEQEQTAVRYYMNHGKCISKTIRALGYPSRALLKQWLRSKYPEEKPRCSSSHSLVHLTQEQKMKAVQELCAREETAQEIASRYNVSRYSVYNWAWELLGKGNIPTMPRNQKDDKDETVTVEKLKMKVNRLAQQAEELEKQVQRLQIEKEVLEKAAEVIKKDEGVNLKNLTNHEKAIVIGALRSKYSLKTLLEIFHMAKSSYCYQKKVLKAPDKYAKVREKIKQAFKESSCRYGYRRIQVILQRNAITVSEKVIRRLMKEEGLAITKVKKRKYNSYAGEITPAVENVIQRDFHADRPNMKWLTDITEFRIPAGKVYLSPIIDCFDGLPVACTIGTSPNADLVNDMLDAAIATLDSDQHPIIHSDRGCHYRWPGWIKRMDDAGLTRSMSRKGCSPDNSACEGFFGRLKNEMFYGRSWKGVSIGQFTNILDEYIHWYAEERIKISLGGVSPIQYRKQLGLTA
jgi:putative transposase